MQIIFIAPKSNFRRQDLNKIGKYGDVNFVENSSIQLADLAILYSPENKILCPFPEPLEWKLSNEVLKNIPKLKGVCLSTTGYEWVDGAFLRKRNIPLTNVPNPPNGVAEGAVYMMMSVARKQALMLKDKELGFIPENLLVELRGKTMGIIGLGRIGKRIAELGQGLGMEVVYWSRKSRDNRFKYITKKQLFSNSDFIFPAVKFNSETRSLVLKKEIEQMKKEAALIDICHKGVVERDYLVRKVEKGKLFGCAFEDDDKSIHDFGGNVFVTRHNNWFTKESVERKIEIWTDSIIGLIKNEPVNVVN